MASADPTRRDLAVLYLAMLTSRIGFGVIIIVFPAYISRSSDLTVAGALALYPVFEAFSSPIMGRVCDTRGRKLVFATSLGYMAVLMGTIGLTRNIYAIASLHAAMGVGAAGVTVSSLTMITDLTGRNNRGAGMGTFDFANIGGYAVGLLLGGRLATTFESDLGVAFFLTAAAVAVAFGFAAFVLKEPHHVSGRGIVGFNPLKALDAKARAILPIWLSITTLIGVVFFLPRALATLGFTGGSTANLLFLGISVLGVGSIGFGALSDRVGRTRVLLVGVVGLLGLLVSVAIAFADGVRGLLHYFPVIGVFAIMTSALVPTILATVGDRAKAESRGSAMGLYSVMLSGGVAVGTVVAGYAHSVGGLSGVFYAGLAIFAIACVSSLVLWDRASKAEARQRIKVSGDGGGAPAGVAQPGQRRGA